VNQRRIVLDMHGRGNFSSKISTVLSIPRSTCTDIVQRLGVRSDLRDRHSYEKHQILEVGGDCDVVRV
jgi:hypothetical protein